VSGIWVAPSAVTLGSSVWGAVHLDKINTMSEGILVTPAPTSHICSQDPTPFPAPSEPGAEAERQIGTLAGGG